MNHALFIQLTQLEILGFHETYQKFAISLGMITIIYFLSKPIIKKLMEGQRIIVLTYWYVSLMTIIIAFLLQELNPSFHAVLISVKAIAFFGFVLIAFLTIQFLFRFLQNKFRGRST